MDRTARGNSQVPAASPALVAQRRFWAIAALVGLALTSCGKEDSGASTAPQRRRLVSVAPALTAIVADLGAADELVGVTRHCDLPAGLSPAPEVIGDFRPIPERVLKARPTLVLMANYATQAHERAGLEALGLPVEAFDLVTLSDLALTVTRLGALLERRDRAAELNRALDAARAGLAACLGAAGRVRGPSYALIYGTEPGFVYSTGGGDHISELLDLAGATNALASHPRTARIGLERVLETLPELIIHVAPTTELRDSASAKAYWARWPEVPAVQNGAIAVWPDDRLARNGSHLAAVAMELCDLVRRAAEAVAAEPRR